LRFVCIYAQDFWCSASHYPVKGAMTTKYLGESIMRKAFLSSDAKRERSEHIKQQIPTGVTRQELEGTDAIKVI
jgi:hypothetical protein